MKKFNWAVFILFMALGALSANISHAMETHKTALFAGGCFWCMHEAFEQLPGVISVSSGYYGWRNSQSHLCTNQHGSHRPCRSHQGGL